MTQAQRLPVRKTKFNGDLWGTFEVYLLQEDDERIITWEPRGTFIHRRSGWAMRFDHLQFFYPNRWFVISADYGTNGLLRHCYCDITMPWQPPTRTKRQIEYIDLELDLRVMPDGSSLIQDEDEFDDAIVTMQYPDHVRDGALLALQMLIESARAWTEPFAQIPLVLPRLDFHALAPDSPEWQIAMDVITMRK